MILASTSAIIRAVTGAAADTESYATFADNTTTAFTPAPQIATITIATTTTVVSAPAASTQRVIKFLILKNTHASTPQTLTLEYYDGVTANELWKGILLPGESIQFTQNGGFQRLDADGSPISTRVEVVTSSVTMDDVMAEGLL